MNFYLAHSVTLMRQVRKWQIMIEGLYTITFTNPFFSNSFESGEDLLSLSKRELTKYCRELTDETCEGILNVDLELLRKSDGIVAYFETFTLGTTMEIFAASYLYRLPVYIISKSHNNHPWLRALIIQNGGKLFNTRSEFKKYLDDNGYRRQ